MELAGLGSAFEYQATDPAVVRKNIEGTKEYVRLAHDIGAPGVKVRPNGIPKGADLDATLRQIGRALHEVGEDAAGFGVEIRVEVHGARHAGGPQLRQDHGLRRPSERLRLLELEPDRRPSTARSARTSRWWPPRSARSTSATSTDETYPWRELFALLTTHGYQGYTLAEIPESTDPDRVLRYFRALWLAYQPASDKA